MTHLIIKKKIGLVDEIKPNYLKTRKNKIFLTFNFEWDLDVIF